MTLVKSNFFRRLQFEFFSLIEILVYLGFDKNLKSFKISDLNKEDCFLIFKKFAKL